MNPFLRIQQATLVQYGHIVVLELLLLLFHVALSITLQLNHRLKLSKSVQTIEPK